MGRNGREGEEEEGGGGGEEGEKVWSGSPLARSGSPPRVSSRRGERGARGGGEGGVWDEANHGLVTGMPISAATPKTCLGNVFIYKVNFPPSLSHTLSLSFSFKFLIRQSSSVLSAAAGKMPVEMCKINRI